jgi:adenine deaminase
MNAGLREWMVRKGYHRLEDFRGKVSGGKVLGRLPLPVAGLMSEGTMAQVRDDIQHIDQVAKDLGMTIEEPFMALSFVTLAVMPDLKLTDLGLIDVRQFKFVDVFADA